MVAHDIGYILDSHLLGRLDPQRHTVLGVMSHGVIHVCVGILRDHIAVAVIECEPSVAENVECAPDSGLASSQRTEIGRAIRITELNSLSGPLYQPCFLAKSMTSGA